MIKITVKLLVLILIGCAIGKQAVYYNEMPTPPTLKIKNNILTIKTSNSIKNSALLIYEVILTVDQNKKEIYLSAFQAVGKDYKDNFTLNLNNYNINNATSYSFYWLEPDKKTIKLDITPENEIEN